MLRSVERDNRFTTEIVKDSPRMIVSAAKSENELRPAASPLFSFFSLASQEHLRSQLQNAILCLHEERAVRRDHQRGVVPHACEICARGLRAVAGPCDDPVGDEPVTRAIQ